jgi:hypothetical protein
MGNTIWTKDYFTRNDLDQYLYDIKTLPDNGYILSGSAFPIDTNIQHAWLMRTNCWGEDGTQYPATGASCESYDCNLFPVNANYSISYDTIDLAIINTVTFQNNSLNATARVWSFGDGTKEYTDSIVTHSYTQVGTYDIQLIVFHGACSDTINQTIYVENTAEADVLFLEPSLEIYPNPSSGNFTFKLNQSVEGSLQIVDLLGRVFSIQAVSKNIQSYELKHLPKGMYFVQLILKNGKQSVKRIEVI